MVTSAALSSRSGMSSVLDRGESGNDEGRAVNARPSRRVPRFSPHKYVRAEARYTGAPAEHWTIKKGRASPSSFATVPGLQRTARALRCARDSTVVLGPRLRGHERITATAFLLRSPPRKRGSRVCGQAVARIGRRRKEGPPSSGRLPADHDASHLRAAGFAFVGEGLFDRLVQAVEAAREQSRGTPALLAVDGT